MLDMIYKTLIQSLMITVFVLFMMVVIEYINVQSKSIWSEKLQRSPFLQILITAFLGITPGCLGAFTVVSMYTHRMMGLAGLVTVMIATSGDGAFIMFALFPGKAFLLHLILFVIAIAAGMILQVFGKSMCDETSHGFIIHPHERCHCFKKELIIPQLKNLSFERAALLLFTIIFIIFLTTGGEDTSWNWKKITFLVGGLFLLFMFVTAPEHFLKEHLYDHILKRHLLRIFLWTFGAFVALHLIRLWIDLDHIMIYSSYWMLLAAVLIGFIPESGPHLIFVTMFSQNLIPFSILLANSIVQDGHGMLPLLAESRRDFIKVKVINIIAGLVIGFIKMRLKF